MLKRGPFTLRKFVGTSRVNVIREPDNVRGTCLSFTHPFFSRTKHCEFVSGTGGWLKFLTCRHTRTPHAHAALLIQNGGREPFGISPFKKRSPILLLLQWSSIESVFLTYTDWNFSVRIPLTYSADHRMGSRNRLHGSFYQSRLHFSGTSAQFARAPTSCSVGPSTSKILVRHR